MRNFACGANYLAPGSFKCIPHFLRNVQFIISVIRKTTNKFLFESLLCKNRVNISFCISFIKRTCSFAIRKDITTESSFTLRKIFFKPRTNFVETFVEGLLVRLRFLQHGLRLLEGLLVRIRFLQHGLCLLQGGIVGGCFEVGCVCPLPYS